MASEILLAITTIGVSSGIGLTAWTARELYNVSQEVTNNSQRSQKNREKLNQIEERFYDTIQS